MRCKFSLLCLLAFLLVLGIAGVGAQPGGGMGGPGGPGGMRREMMEKMRDQMEALQALPVDEMWAILSLGMTLSDDQLKALKLIMADAWKKRQAYLELAKEHGSWKEYGEELKDMRKTLDKQVKAILTKDQQKEYKALMKKQERVRPERGW